jgi:hypothetical protein
VIGKFYSWLCSFTIAKWTKFKTYTAFLRHDAKAYPLIWLVAFLLIGIAVSQSSPLIQDHTTISVIATLLLGALLGHLFW